MSDNRPIIVEKMVNPRAIEVGDFRIAQGLPDEPAKKCPHRHLVYGIRERRIWCKDCHSTVDGFTAFMVLVTGLENMLKDVTSMREEAMTALRHSVRSRAVKALDKAWTRRAKDVACPHCGEKLLPEHFASIGPTNTTRDGDGMSPGPEQDNRSHL